MQYMMAVVDDADPFRSSARGCTLEKRATGDAILITLQIYRESPLGSEDGAQCEALDIAIIGN